MELLSAAEAARERGKAIVQRSAKPAQRRSCPDVRLALRSPYRAAAAATPAVRAQFQVDRAAGGTDGLVALRGYASVYEQPFEMWDMFGPYSEVVSAGAGAVSLATGPDVQFLFNHRDMPMARRAAGFDGTEHASGTLHLSEDDHGLISLAYPLMALSVSQQVAAAVEAGLLDEMSYAFCITRGSWSPDYMEYRIYEYDINRGDTSVVTYGANPFTDVSVERAEPALTGLGPQRLAAARTALFSSLTR